MKDKFRTILVDDQRLARKDLRSLLAEYQNIEIVGEADSVSSAIELINATLPDLIFLDIQMPGETGFDLLEKIDIKAQVIFVTAFDEYAIRAFEVDAIDYLLKPVSPDRLRNAIDRLEKKNFTQEAPKRKLNYDDCMFLIINSHPKFLKIKSILSIKSAKDYSEILTVDGKKGLVPISMMEWESRLPENSFARIHRSTIVNLDYIEKVEKWFNNSYRVYLRGVETPFEMSRRYTARILERLG
jgi:two-component system, LytTR family, response regulator